MVNKIVYILLGLSIFIACKKGSTSHTISKSENIFFKRAEINGIQANKGFNHSIRYVHAWLNEADSVSGLIPRNVTKDKDIWNPKDAAADNYPFMVLSSAILNQNLFHHVMRQMLESEIHRTSRIGSLPDTYSFSKQGFAYPLESAADTGRVIFGSAEYMKDGLLPLTEWLGKSMWSKRMIDILKGLKGRNTVIKDIKGKYYGNDPDVEINGDLLQVLSRMYWFTGNSQYLDWAIQIGNYYLLGDNRLINKREYLRLRDHGCEIIGGLSELYFTLSSTRPSLKKKYKESLHELLDRILEIGRNKDGLLYNAVDPVNGKIVDDGLADTWGYIYDAYYTVYLVDHTQHYKKAVIHVLRNIHKYKNFNWEPGNSFGNSDGYADAIESAINLYNRLSLKSTAQWINSQIKVMWGKQQKNGLIEGWHGDGNFARTTQMYCLWKTQGITARPWNKNLIFGAVKQSDSLFVTIETSQKWKGKILFDNQRYKENMHMPVDYPRINQFPEWFTIHKDLIYHIQDLNQSRDTKIKGTALEKGYAMTIKPDEKYYLLITSSKN